MPQAHIASTGILDLISQSGLVAKFVLLLLVGASVLCWTVIVAKWKLLGTAAKQDEKFQALFWSGKSLDEIVAKSENLTRSPIAAAFKVAIKELRKISTGDSQTYAPQKLDNIQRSLIRASTHEIASLEKNLGWL